MKRSALIGVIFWFCLILVLFGLMSRFMPYDVALLNAVLNIGIAALAYYINAKWGFPKFFREKNNWRFLAFSVALVIVFSFILGFLDLEIMQESRPVMERPDHPRKAAYGRAFFWILIFQLGGTVSLLQNRLRDQAVESKQIGEEKLQTELKLLKAQINPHFLFNALNNIYSLSYMKSEMAPESILRLSQMLRYVIEDCQDDHVKMDKEVDYIKSYIAFQDMKSPDKQKIAFKVKDLNSDLLVSPLVFMPFIENSFKYSRIEDDDDAYINIELSSVDNIIRFSIRNSIPLSGRPSPGAGTGLENVKQRLEILYPGAHQLDIRELKNEYIVNMEIIPK